MRACLKVSVPAGMSRAGLSRSHHRGFTLTREGARSESVQNTNDGGIRRQNSRRYHHDHGQKKHKST